MITNKTTTIGSMVAIAGILATALVLAPGTAPKAYAASASGASGITEGASSAAAYADKFRAIVATSAGPSGSNSAGGEVAVCRGPTNVLSIAFNGACTTSN